ncbi:Tctex-1 family-domain-containing protein [Glomus cerebriforme]|uniref:Tctex-1 family-domain-containing protein n=1 Tax=Glomus cerebriforme TaxID=658196 RepID=A0A397TFV2_9GLOM|nr:Tctex-1 family-domain-containing protein [Glomus cerebriforme]
MSYGEIQNTLPEKVQSSVMVEYERRGSEPSLRPAFFQKFRAPPVKTMIQQIVSKKLDQAIYNKDHAPGWAHEIAEEIKQKLLEMELSRYKYIVNVTIMENKGAGARMQVNCLWDSDTDNLAQETFKNETIICVVMVFGVYFY